MKPKILLLVSLVAIGLSITSCKKESSNITLIAPNFLINESTHYFYTFVTAPVDSTFLLTEIINTTPVPIFRIFNGHMLLSPDDEIRFLNSGDIINSSTSEWSSSTCARICPTSIFGQGIKYLAFYFSRNGANHYGWIKLNFTGTNSFIIEEIAYNNNPEEAINAGQ